MAKQTKTPTQTKIMLAGGQHESSFLYVSRIFDWFWRFKGPYTGAASPKIGQRPTKWDEAPQQPSASSRKKLAT